MSFQYLELNKKEMARKKYEQIVDLMADYQTAAITLNEVAERLNKLRNSLMESTEEFKLFCEQQGYTMADVEKEYPELVERFNLKAFGPNYKQKYGDK